MSIALLDVDNEATDLRDRLLSDLAGRKNAIDHYEAYYRGEHNLAALMSEQFVEMFASRYRHFSDNWTAPVVWAPTERLVPIGIRLHGELSGADSDLWRVWRENNLDADSGLAFVDALVTGRSFVLVWPNADDPDTPEVWFEHPSQTIVDYAEGSRRKRRAALKLWTDGSDDFCTLYTPGWVYKYSRPVKAIAINGQSRVVGVDKSGWIPRDVPGEIWPLPNPLGVVPMVELPNLPSTLYPPMSEIHQVVPLQDGINKLWTELFSASDSMALPQRVLLGSPWPVEEVFDENDPTKVIGTQAVSLERLYNERIAAFPGMGGQAPKIDAWPAADLDKFISVIDRLVKHLAAQTRTPPHYLLADLVNVSAEGLKIAETGLVKKVEERQTNSFGPALREMFALIALAQGLGSAQALARAKAVRGGTMLWRNAENRSEAQLMDALLKAKSIGFPFEYVVEQWTDDPVEVARIMTMYEAEQRKAAEADAAAITAAVQMNESVPEQLEPAAEDDEAA